MNPNYFIIRGKTCSNCAVNVIVVAIRAAGPTNNVGCGLKTIKDGLAAGERPNSNAFMTAKEN